MGIVGNPAALIAFSNLENEHSSPRTFLLRRSPRGNHGGGAQYPLRHPAARGERTGGAVGRVSWCHAVSAPAICPHTRGRKIVPVHPTLLFKSGRHATDLQGGKARQIRIGASTIVLRDHLPELFQNVRKKYPNLKIALREAYHPELESLLEKDELDLAVTLIEKKSAPGIHSLALLELPLVLLVEKSSKITAPEQLWKRDKIEEPLICLPSAEAICKHFQQGLAKLGVDWFPSIEVSSVDLIETYVGNGFGIGVSVLVPRGSMSPNVRALPLPDFAPVIMGALWQGKTSALLQIFLDELQLRAKRLA